MTGCAENGRLSLSFTGFSDISIWVGVTGYPILRNIAPSLSALETTVFYGVSSDG